MINHTTLYYYTDIYEQNLNLRTKLSSILKEKLCRTTLGAWSFVIFANGVEI